MRNLSNRDSAESGRAEADSRDLAAFPSGNPNPVLRIARDGKILYANAASEPILRSFDRGVGQALPEAWGRHVATAFACGPQREVELKVDQRVYAVALMPIVEADYVNVYARDITKRRQVEEELRVYHEHLEELVRKRTLDLEQSEARAQLIKQVAATANAARTSDAALQVTITAIARHTGWPVAHVYQVDAEVHRAVPTDLWYLRDPRHFQPFREITLRTNFEPGAGLPGRVLATGKPCWIEDVTKDGNFLRTPKGVDLKIFGAFGFPVILRGKVAVVLEFFSDAPAAPDLKLLGLMEQIGVQLSIVIERKQAEAALLDSEQNYRTLVDMTPEIIYRLDENGRISFISSAIEQLGYQRQELIGKPFAELVHPDDREKVTNRFVERRVGGRSMKDVEVRLLEKCGDNSGRDYVLRWRSVALCSRGRWNVPDEEIQRSDKVFQCTQGVAHDISESKRAEKELERSKEAAEAASRAKSDFLANMSHELRTPLNAIIGFSEILQDLTFGPLNPKQSRYVDNVLTSGRHLLNLINDILDLSKVEAGKMKLEAAPLRVKAALEDALVLVKEKALKHSLDLILDAPDDLTITADERKFKQIMFNLLSNAAKFTPDGGRITVAAERCAGNVQISVTDTGIGIKPEDQSSLFREFQQIDSSLARKHEGTGLGLALSRKFAELHGGRIWVESPGAGKGSTFRFVMPLEQPGMRAKTLERIEWTADEFGVGVSLFNRQHQRLCGMINMLIDAQDTKSNQDLASRILSFMIEYAGEHFHDEEQLMSQYAYPDLDEHVRQHRAFVVKTTELLTAAKQGDEALPDKVLEFLRYWLTHHILGVDMKYKAFFGAKGVS